MTFSFFPDLLKILPELLLLLLALLIIGGDLFSGDLSPEQRAADAASTTLLGLILIFSVTFIQSGFFINRFIDVATLDLPINLWITRINLGDILRNWQSVTSPLPGPDGQPLNVLLNGALVIDPLTMIGRLLFIGAAISTVLLARNYRQPGNAAEFYSFLILSTTGLNLMAGAGEMITAYLALELASISLYIMCGYFKSELRSSEAGIKYYVFGVLSSAVLLYGLSLWYGYAAFSGVENPTTFAAVAQAVFEGADSRILYLALILIISGLGYKVAVVPFHAWSPDVYQGAPTPVTAFLSTASKTAGFLLLYRVLVEGFGPMAGGAEIAADFGGWAAILAFIAFLTMTYGNLAAITQTNAKRLLAYSSIAHAGFLLLGLIAVYLPGQPGNVTQFGVQSLVYYLIVYTFTNLGAFGVLAVVSRSIGGDDLRDLDGLYRRNLGLACLMAIFVLSLAGIPPLSGFLAKFLVFQAAWEGGAIWLVVVGVINTLIALYYYLRILKAMFIHEPLHEQPVPVPAGMGISIIFSAIFVVLMGMLPNLFLPALEAASQIAGR